MSKRLVAILLVLTMLFWAVNFHVVKIALKYYSAMPVAAWRFFFAVIVLFGIMALRKNLVKRIKELSKRDVWYIFLVSVVGVYLSVYLFNKGLMTTSAINGSLIVSISPMLTALFARIFLYQKINFIQAAAILFGFFGVAIILVQGSLSALISLQFQPGDIDIFLMAICFSLSQIIVNKHLYHIDSIWMMTLASAMALVLFVASAGPELMTTAIPQTPSFWASILFMGILSTGVGYVVFYMSVVRLGPTTSTLFMNLIPFFAVLLAIPFGEPIYSNQLVGGAVIIGSLILFNRFANNRAETLS